MKEFSSPLKIGVLLSNMDNKSIYKPVELNMDMGHLWWII